MTNDQIILGIILLVSYISVHVLIIIRMRKANKEASKILEDLLPPKDDKIIVWEDPELNQEYKIGFDKPKEK